ncbi:MAG: UDP-N-acetylmuramoyl-tripeptide--D-alanyl-D-alanine ligase [Nitrospirota bacterium]
MNFVESRLVGKMTIEDLIAATQGEILAQGPLVFSGVSTDSRTIQEGELFVPLKGKTFDGHDYLLKALERGSGAVVSRKQDVFPDGKTILRVKDTLRALQDIAHHMRLARDIPAVAITGSNGKTTTKELVAGVLGTERHVLKNAGNLNNQIGLPLSLTRITDEDEVIVLEMGASAPGDIRELCNVAAPNCGVLTNINYTHLQGFKDLTTIRKTKLELLEYVDTVVANADDLFLMEGIKKSGFRGKIIGYGINHDADVRAMDIRLHEIGSSLVLQFSGDEAVEVSPKISGMFNIYNILAAASVGHLFGIAPIHIRQAVESFSGVPMRLKVKEMSGMIIVRDVYNANPASMEAAIREMVRIRKGRTIAVLGDMLELGVYAEEAHQKIGRLLSDLSVDIFIAVGPLMFIASSEFHGHVFIARDSDEADKLLRNTFRSGDTVLIKGSRGMSMERVLDN